MTTVVEHPKLHLGILQRMGAFSAFEKASHPRKSSPQEISKFVVTQKFLISNIGKNLPARVYYHKDFIKSAKFIDLYRDPRLFYKQLVRKINETATTAKNRSIRTIQNPQSRSKRSFTFEVQVPDFTLSSGRAEQYVVDEAHSLDQRRYFWESLAIDYIRLDKSLRLLHRNDILLANISCSTVGFYFGQASFFDYSKALVVPKAFENGRRMDRYHLALAFLEYLVGPSFFPLISQDPNHARATLLGFMGKQPHSQSKIDFQNRLLLGLSEFQSIKEYLHKPL